MSEKEQPETLNPVSQVYFRAGLLACREYMARFVEAQNPEIAASIRANWWPSLGPDFGPPRQLDWGEVTTGEYGTDDFRSLTADEVSPTQEALPLALGFIELHGVRPAPAIRPIDLLLFCPACGTQHVDEAKPGACETCGHPEGQHIAEDLCSAFPDQVSCTGDDVECRCLYFTAWLNPPHKSHRCTACNHVWRPADVPTNGVKEIKTKGERDGDATPQLQGRKELLEACKAALNIHHYTVNETSRARIGQTDEALKWAEKVNKIHAQLDVAIAKATEQP